MRNPKTTVLGILAILSAVLSALQFSIDGDPTTNPDWASVAAAVTAGIGLIFAKDSTPKP